MLDTFFFGTRSGSLEFQSHFFFSKDKGFPFTLPLVCAILPGVLLPHDWGKLGVEVVAFLRHFSEFQDQTVGTSVKFMDDVI